MNTQSTYFIILTASLAGPLLLSFDKKVAFYKQWRYLFPAMLLPALFYIGWDSWFTQQGVWSFNPQRITGTRLGNLPVEEVLFFFVVPYCCIFIYECIRCYFPRAGSRPVADRLLQVLAIVLFVVGLYFHERSYTCLTFVFTALFIAAIYSFRNFFRHFDAAFFLLAFLITLIPFLVVNGFLTSIPVVLYNDTENLGVRIYTIPFEDTFYGMLLMMMDIALFEKLRARRRL